MLAFAFKIFAKYANTKKAITQQQQQQQQQQQRYDFAPISAGEHLAPNFE